MKQSCGSSSIPRVSGRVRAWEGSTRQLAVLGLKAGVEAAARGFGSPVRRCLLDLPPAGLEPANTRLGEVLLPLGNEGAFTKHTALDHRPCEPQG